MSSPRRTATAALAAATVIALGLTAAPAQAAERGGKPEAVAKHSLRKALTDQNFYFVMGDRFANGDPTNDEGGLTGDRNVTGLDTTSKAFYHGGDIQGLMSELDYLEGLGTEAVWFTPIFKNKAVQLEDGPSAGYHGYWITDFTQVDPHLGTNQDLADLVDAAHARGIKIFFDIITNHTADVIGYEEGARTAYISKDTSPYRKRDGVAFDDRNFAGGQHFPNLDPDVSFPYHPVLEPGEEDLKVPGWLNNVKNYHNRGDTTFTGEDSQYGDFFGLDDLFTEQPRVVKGMQDIYETWVGDFGIDGFRIDTMKHVNDEFWQQFGPGLLKYAHQNGKPDFFMFGEVALDGSGPDQKAFTSHYTTHDKMQSVLDFPFQAAARDFASKGAGAADLSRFFDNDDWYTDKDSNAYQLPTFLGNHDMGRIGYFLKADNPGASDDELLARDTLAHQLMYLVRGNPVLYYGDEQGFTGSGGDQLARQDMFPSQVSDWPDGFDQDSIGTEATPEDDNFDPTHPLYASIADLAELTETFPALRNGAMQTRVASDGPGIFAFSRVDRADRREYVVALNNSEDPAEVEVPTYVRNGEFETIYESGPDVIQSGTNGDLTVSLDGLSAIVLRSAHRMPKSKKAPKISLAKPKASKSDRGRMRVLADVAGSKFSEVTFQAKIGAAKWRRIGTDDNAPYRVFHDVSDLAPGQKVRYRAVVLDNNRHARMSRTTKGEVPSPTIKITQPTDGANITVFDPVTVLAEVSPERSTQRVRFERSIQGKAWKVIGVDTSSPAYSVQDDIATRNLALGKTVSYRAVLIEKAFPRVTSKTVTVTTAEPEPARDSVTVAGSLQSELGCEGGDNAGDWLPDCAATHLGFDTTDGQWHGEFTLPEGDYEWKVAIDDAWDESYGANGGGDNLPLSVPAGGATYVFTWNQVTHVPSVELQE